MSAFEFTEFVRAKLASVNVRSEKHGPELVPAVDLKIVVDASNDILSKFHPELKEALYYRAQQDDAGQDDLVGIEPVTNLPNLRFPKLDTPLKWDHSGAGYRCELDYGLGGDSNLVLEGIGLNNFSVDPKEGGTVELSFRLQISGIDETIIGRLATLCQHEVTIMLLAPKVEDVQASMQAMESPFLNQAELDADTSGEPVNPFPQTPEEALAASALAE